MDDIAARAARILRPYVGPWRSRVAEQTMMKALSVELPDIRIGPGSVVLDLGANRGRFSRMMAKQGAQVLAFEPMPIAAKAAERALRKFPRATLYQVAVGGAAGFAPIFAHMDADKDPLGYSISASLLSDKANIDPSSGEQVLVVPLYPLLDAFASIDLIKVDIEGSEISVWPAIRDNAGKIKHLLMELHHISPAHTQLSLEIDEFIRVNGLQGAWSTNWL